MNKGDNQVRAAHKILGYDPIHKSFSTSKYVIRAKDPQLHGITVAKHIFLLPKGSSAQGSATLAGSSSSYQVAEAEEVRAKSKSLNWASPRTNLAHLTKSICPRIPLVICATPA